MTLSRFALIAFVSSVTLAAQFASADLRYGPTYDPANRIEDLACALKNEVRSDYQNTRFDGSLVGIACAIEGNSQAILRLARTGRDQSQAIISIAGTIRRLAVTGQQRLIQIEGDVLRGRGMVCGTPCQARQMLAEIDRLAAYIAQVAAVPPQAFVNGNQGCVHGHPLGQPFGGYPQAHGSQFGNRFSSGYRGGFNPQFRQDLDPGFGPAYDDRFVQPVQPTSPVPPQVNVPVEPQLGWWGWLLGR